MAARIHIAILVVDDEEAQCRRLYDILTQARFDAVTFSRPHEALTHLSNLCNGAAEPGTTHVSGIWRYSVALIDLNMPETAGPTLVADIRRISPPTRVLGMAAFPDAAEILAAFRAGVADVIEKPIQPERLIGVIERQLAISGVAARDEDQFNQWLGARIRRVRTLSERTLSEIAEIAGVTAAQLSQIESGKSATTTWTLGRICAALRVPMWALFDEAKPA